MVHNGAQSTIRTQLLRLDQEAYASRLQISNFHVKNGRKPTTRRLEQIVGLQDQVKAGSSYGQNIKSLPKLGRATSVYFLQIDKISV